MSKFFIFDIDGTLIDSNRYHILAWLRAFRMKGIDIDPTQIRKHIGKGADQFLGKFLPQEEIAAFGKELNEFQGEIFKWEYLVRVRPFPKVRELFTGIRNAGGKIALASSSKTEQVQEYEIIAQIEDLVEKSSSADDADRTKPAPDILEAAWDRLERPSKRDVIVVGDTPDDATAAKRAGFSVLGVLSLRRVFGSGTEKPRMFFGPPRPC
jgi:HAD superfamily hydrolase (TIGR01549 family)